MGQANKGACEVVGWISRLCGRWRARINSAATGLVVILMHLLFRCQGFSVHAFDNLLALLTTLPPLSKLQQMPGLDLEQAALDGGGATQPPQQTCQSEHEFFLNS